MKAMALGETRTDVVFNFEGLIPNGVRTLENVPRPMPIFSDESLGPEAFGRHRVIADPDGLARSGVAFPGSSDPATRPTTKGREPHVRQQ